MINLILVASLLLSPLPPYEETEEFRQIIENVKSWTEQIEEAKEDYSKEHISTDLLLAIVAHESKGNNKMIGSLGERCIFQVNPADWMGYADSDILEIPEYCISWALFFLDNGLKICNGDEDCALRVYNCGPRRAKDGCGWGYVDQVQNYWRPYFSLSMESANQRAREIRYILARIGPRCLQFSPR